MEQPPSPVVHFKRPRVLWLGRLLPSLEPPPKRPVARVYDQAYVGAPNWDIGRPQRAFVYLVEAGLVQSPVLEVGCGTGELSMFLARKGYRTLGVDISEVAVAQAREKARWRQVDVRFFQWDALYLGRLAEAGLSFNTVVDCAMFHVLRDDHRDRFVQQLGQLVPSGGLYAVLGDVPDRAGYGYGLTPREIQQRFERAGGWEVAFAHRTVFERRYSTNPAHLVGVRRR